MKIHDRNRRSSRCRLLGTLTVVGLACLCLSCGQDDAKQIGDADDATHQGDALPPDGEAPDGDATSGEPLDLAVMSIEQVHEKIGTLEGKVVVLDLWALW